MENENNLENFFDEYESVLVDGMPYEMMTPAENYIYNGEEEEGNYLKYISTELATIIEALKKQAALTQSDVEYYKVQSQLLDSKNLKQEYLISKYKLSLIINKLNYFVGVNNTIGELLGKGRELKK